MLKKLLCTGAFMLSLSGFAQAPKEATFKGNWQLHFYYEYSDAEGDRMDNIGSTDDLLEDGFSMEKNKKPKKNKFHLPRPTEHWGTIPLPQPAITSMTRPPFKDAELPVWPSDEDKERPIEKYTSAWIRNRANVPEDWKGKLIRFETGGLVCCDALLYVNGKKAGVIRRPEGSLDVSKLVEYGKQNEFILFVTSVGKQIKPEFKKYFLADFPGKEPKTAPNFMMQNKPALVAYAPVTILDVFANTSAQQKKLTLETTVLAQKDCSAEFNAVIKDQDGKVVKKIENEKLNLKTGENIVFPTISWDAPVYWEFDRPYLYTCEARVKLGGSEHVFKPFTFGFREIWRKGKDLYMNGHKAYIRAVYHHHSNVNGMRFLHDHMGNNTILMAHRLEVNPQFKREEIDAMNKLGIGLILATPNINYFRLDSFGDKEVLTDYGRYIKAFMKQYRNDPSVIGFYVGVNMIVPGWNMPPDWIAQQDPSKEEKRFKMVTNARDVCHKVNPNVLFYAHGDGSCGDMSSNNLYLNFAVLQEREDWLSKWSVNGKYPYHVAEFGQPFDGRWNALPYSVNAVTEYSAIYYGPWSYENEPVISMYSSPCRFGTWRGTDPVFTKLDYPAFRRYRSELTRKTIRSWRVWGINGGMVWFNVYDAYGNQKGTLEEPIYNFDKPIPPGRPAWANYAYDPHRLDNQTFLGYIAGHAPETEDGWRRPSSHTDKTHAYYGGSEVKKQLIFLWDGAWKTTVTAKWVATLDGKEIADGKVEKTLGACERNHEKISFKVPSVRKKTAGKIKAVYTQDGKEIINDEFDFEVYPEFEKISGAPAVRLVEGLDNSASKILETLGVPVKDKSQYLVIGKDALNGKDFPFNAKDIENGLNVMILPQTPYFYQDLSMYPLDAMSRIIFKNDFVSKDYADLTQDMLSYWAGVPKYGCMSKGKYVYNDFGNAIIYPGNALGGHTWHWLRTHTVAGVTLKVPTRAGFEAPFLGEFDMNYAGVLRFRYGKGSVTFCQLDFENRANVPDAMITAKAVFQDFLSKRPDAVRTVEAVGKKAEAVCEWLKPAMAESGKGSLLLIGPDAEISWSDVQARNKSGAAVVIYANEKLMKEAGFGLKQDDSKYTLGGDWALRSTKQGLKQSDLNKMLKKYHPTTIYRVKADSSDPLFRYMPVAWFRFRGGLPVAGLIQSAPSGFDILADGLFAVKRGDNPVVVTAADPEAIIAPFAADIQAINNKIKEFRSGPATNAIKVKALEAEIKADVEMYENFEFSTEHLYQMFSTIFGNLNVKPCEENITTMLEKSKAGKEYFSPRPNPWSKNYMDPYLQVNY